MAQVVRLLEPVVVQGQDKMQQQLRQRCALVSLVGIISRMPRMLEGEVSSAMSTECFVCLHSID